MIHSLCASRWREARKHTKNGRTPALRPLVRQRTSGEVRAASTTRRRRSCAGRRSRGIRGTDGSVSELYSGVESGAADLHVYLVGGGYARAEQLDEDEAARAGHIELLDEAPALLQVKVCGGVQLREGLPRCLLSRRPLRVLLLVKAVKRDCIGRLDGRYEASETRLGPRAYCARPTRGPRRWAQ